MAESNQMDVGKNPDSKSKRLSKKSMSSMLSVPSVKTCGKATAAITALVIWEHVGRLNESVIRPAIGLGVVKVVTQDLFRTMGEMTATISSFLTRLDLQELVKTIDALVTPTFEICTSPLQFFRGYFAVAKTFLQKHWMIYLGSGFLVTFLSTLAWVIHKYPNRYSVYLQKLCPRRYWPASQQLPWKGDNKGLAATITSVER